MIKRTLDMTRVAFRGVLIASLLSLLASAQLVRYDSQVIGPKGVAPSQNVAICSPNSNMSSQPCSPLATLFTENIASISRSVGVTTVTTAGNHGLGIGAAIVISGVADNTYNGPATVASVISSTTFTYLNPGSDGSSSGGTIGGPNPITTDALGNYNFYAAVGSYDIQIYGPQVATQFVLRNITLGGNGTPGGPILLSYLNCPTTGTVLNGPVQLAQQSIGGNPTSCVIGTPAGSTSAIGICNANCGTSGVALIAYQGTQGCIFTGTTTIGDVAATSTTANNQCDDVGATRLPGVQSLGRISNVNAGVSTVANVILFTGDMVGAGGSGANGTVNNAPQFAQPFYSSPGSNNQISGDTKCATDGVGNQSGCNSIKVGTPGTLGQITYGNNPVAGSAAKPASSNSTTFTDINGNFLCINGAGTSCTGTTVDVRVGYGNSGGVDCSGATDSTANLQAMINNAPDFTKFVFPVNCKVLVSTTGGAPKAITIQSRAGLEFWFEGRNASSCDLGNTGPGGAAIIDNSTYVSGATIFYINQSQRLLFHNVVMRLNGAVDIGFDVDQTTSPPITTANIWENACVQNNATRNASFKGWRFSNTSTNNIEAQSIIHPYVQCSSQAATSYTSNGYGIWFSPANSNQKTEVVDAMTTNNCSIDEVMGTGSDYTATNFLMSNSYSNVQAGTFNNYISGMRSENATYPISVVNPNGPLFVLHSDLASIQGGGRPLDCTQGTPTQGCGFVIGVGDEADTAVDFINPTANGANTGGFLVGLRNITINQFEWQNGVFATGSLNGVLGFTPILNTFGEYLSPSVSPNVNSNNQQSAPFVLESAYGSTPSFDTNLFQNIPNGGFGNITNATFVLGAVNKTSGLGGAANWPGTGITHWLAFLGNQSGMNVVQSPQPVAPILNVVGGTGSTCYTYLFVAHGNVGTTQAGTSAQTCLGPLVLTGSNYVRLSLPATPGATYYDVYRTQCAGNGICLTNPTGIIGQMAAVIYVNGLQSAASAISLFDTGLTGGGQTAPTTNTTGVIVGALQAAPSTFTIYPATDSTCTVYSSSGTQYCAVSNSGGVQFTGTDAAVVINNVLGNLSATGGTLYFRNGVYSLNSATAETNSGCTSDFYSIGIPTGGQYNFKFVGESLTTWVGEGSAPIQTNGVLFNVTSTAVTAAGSNFLAAIWQRPSGGSACSGFTFNNYDSFRNIAVRFPTNQRGNEGGFVMWAAEALEYRDVLADFNIQYSSIATGSAPVVGTAGSFGITGTYNSSGNDNYFYDANATGWDICYDLGEHTMGDEFNAIYCNHAAEIGRTGTANLFHGVMLRHFVDQENLSGVLIGPTVQAGTIIDLLNYDIEIGNTNWYTRTTGGFSESNPGFATGIISFETVLQGSGPVTYPLFVAGQGQSTQFTVVAPVAPQHPYNQIFTDNFTRITAGTLGHNWILGNQAGNSAIPIVSNKAQVSPSNVGWQSVFGYFTNNQFASITIGTVTSNANSKAGALVRNSSTVQTFYRLMCAGTGSTTSITMDKTVAGTGTTLATSAQVCTTGDTLEIDIIGTQIFGYYTPNGGTQPTVVLTANDSAITSGNPGMLINGSGATTSVTGFSAGSLTGLRTNANAMLSTPTNCSAVGTAANPSVVSCASSTTGAFSCATNASGGSCVVNTNAVTANSNIFVWQRQDTTTGTRLGVTCNTTSATAPAGVTAVTAGTSFTINLGTITTNPMCFNYMIVN